MVRAFTAIAISAGKDHQPGGWIQGQSAPWARQPTGWVHARWKGNSLLGTRGAALEVLLHASSGSERLDASALDTVRRWKFVPARLGSEAVAATVLVPIAFSLKD